MVYFCLVLALFNLSLPDTTLNIEKAFLQNDPRILYRLFPPDSHLNVSFPEPISFSDQITNQQAYFLFRKIFSTYTTFEFYSQTQIFVAGPQARIFKARWSFMDKTDNQHVLQIFFFLSAAGLPGSPEDWRITEIRAEGL